MSKLLFLLLLIAMCKGLDLDNLKLKQVLIFSRHNVRYPVGRETQRFSPKPWPALAGKLGYLTPRGGLLEGYMGKYFSQWFEKEQFLPEGCPDEDTVYVYANTKNRTKETARAFVDSAFEHCNVTVHHENTEEPDPLFSPVIHNTTEAYRDMVFEEINRKLQNNNLKLKEAYKEMNRILDIENSDVCKQDGVCDLTEANNTILYKVGKEVWIDGPLYVGNSALDTFIMGYYNGMPMQDIAWGEITSPEQWKLLTEIVRQDQIIRYSTVAKDIAALLVGHLTKTFKKYNEMPKLMLIVGHDYNINAIINSMGFESIDLPNQLEKYPIGGKLVFQRWEDGTNEYLKVEYVYSSWSQVRFGTKLSLEDPPQRVVMRLSWCRTDGYGFCPWNEFVDKL